MKNSLNEKGHIGDCKKARETCFAVCMIVCVCAVSVPQMNSGCVLEYRHISTSRCVTPISGLTYNFNVVTIWSLYPTLYNVYHGDILYLGQTLY